MRKFNLILLFVLLPWPLGPRFDVIHSTFIAHFNKVDNNALHQKITFKKLV